jgi:hypothetical protein
MSTAVEQTVEARLTKQPPAVTATHLPPTVPATIPFVATQPDAETGANTGSTITETVVPGQPAATSNGKPCYAMTFMSDISIPDGMIIAPGTTFTKTWRVRNDGNCVWDQKYSLVLDKGDALSSVTSFPLTKVVNPGDSMDISIDMVAPTTAGDYTGYWHIATPFGGFMGVGSYNQSLIVKITVTSKPDRDFGVVSVVYDYNRQPSKGCGSDGADYNFSATITVNAPGEIDYRWDRNPFDGTIVHGTLKFAAAGSKTVNWTWRMTMGHIEDIDRWVAITTTVGSKSTTFDRILFKFTCQQ